jgi:hypothetical protein
MIQKLKPVFVPKTLLITISYTNVCPLIVRTENVRGIMPKPVSRTFIHASKTAPKDISMILGRINAGNLK